MFTGLIERVGGVVALAPQPGGGARLSLDLGPLAQDAKPGDSVSVDGCCLTVVSRRGAEVVFDVVPESLRRTTVGSLKPGDRVNLERALLPGQRLGGHFVQGHVDGTAVVTKTVPGEGWAEWRFALDDAALAPQLVEKGSIAVDGISLTVADVGPNSFSVAVIPHTLENTTLGDASVGGGVNLETDIIGKYVCKLMGKAEASSDQRLLEKLSEGGFV